MAKRYRFVRGFRANVETEKVQKIKKGFAICFLLKGVRDSGLEELHCFFKVAEVLQKPRRDECAPSLNGGRCANTKRLRAIECVKR